MCIAMNIVKTGMIVHVGPEHAVFKQIAENIKRGSVTGGITFHVSQSHCYNCVFVILEDNNILEAFDK